MSHPSGLTQKSKRLPPNPPRSRVDPKSLFQALLDLFPEAEVDRLARETGFLQHHRKLDPVAFLYSLALEVGPEIERSLEELRHTYNTRTDDPLLSYGGFYERFTPELVEFLHQAVLLALARFRHGPGNHLKEKVSHLSDILVQDSTVIRLVAALATVYPATRSRKPAAGVKVATLLSLRNGGPHRLELFGERTSEIDTLKLGSWVKGSLLLMDLGF
jgi:hypothetical protein